ncbi:MAG: hypothetical protein KDG50_01610 [Chromatiales bacterium]|nr:hypothetical protein [Chromatiales bacterium]
MELQEDPESELDPDWDALLHVSISPRGLIHALYTTAHSVHTGWESCVDPKLVLSEISTEDALTGNLCRLVELEFVEDDDPDGTTWHDWTVELRLGEVWITAHWHAAVHGSGHEWDWCAAEAENAFARACVVIGKRVRRGAVVEETPLDVEPRVSHTHH